jgi:hypothetical protein
VCGTKAGILTDYLREALNVWLVAGVKINYSAQDNDILTVIGFRPDAALRDDNREKFTPAQNWLHSRPLNNSLKSRHFSVKKPCILRCMVLHSFCRHAMPRQRQHWRALRPLMHLH